MGRRGIKFSLMGLTVALVATLVLTLMPAGVSINQGGFLSVSPKVVLAVNNPPNSEFTDQPYQVGDEVIERRTRNSKTHWLGGASYSWDGTIGSIHYEDNGWQEIDNYFEPALAPWDWQMLKAGYHIRVKEDFTAGQIIEFEKQGETVQLQPMALEWTNDLDQIQSISIPQGSSPVITNPEVDLLPAVGMPSHQGTIRWDNAYGEGIDFEWKCSATRLLKILTISGLSDLPPPEQYILVGGNPALRLNLILDPSKGVDIYIDGLRWNESTKKQTFKVIEFREDGEVLWGFMPLRYWGSGTDPETNEGQSVATLEKRGKKLYISVRVPYEWLQSAAYPVFIDVDVDETVEASSDDCYRRITTSSWSLTRNQVLAGAFSGTYYKYGGGMRFQTVAIEGTIDVGYITLVAQTNKSDTEVKSRISAENVDDAPTFANDAAAFDARWANRTGARVEWDDIPTWTEGSPYSSPSIVSVLQEIVDRGGWASGQDIVLFWEDYEDRTAHLDKLRIGSSYDSGIYDPPKLHIEYAEADISNAPTSKAFSNVSESTSYWSKGSAPTWPLDDSECYFTVTNNGDPCSITVEATNFTGGDGWTLTSGSPGSGTVRLKAGKSGDANEDAMITLTTSPQAFISGLTGTGSSVPVVESTTSSNQDGDSTSFVMDMPVIRPDDDLYIAWVVKDDDNAFTSIPENWIELDVGIAGAEIRCGLWYWIGSSEPASYTVEGDSEEWSGAILHISGAHATTPINKIGTATTGTDATAEIPEVTPDVDNPLLLAFAGIDTDFWNTTGQYPDGWDGLFTQNSGSSESYSANAIGASKSGTKDTPSGAGVFTANGSDGWRAMTIAIAPVIVSSTKKWELKMETGTFTDGVGKTSTLTLTATLD